MGALDWIKRPHGLECVDPSLSVPVVLYENHEVVPIGNGTPEECRHTEIRSIETKAACGPMKTKALILRTPAALADGKLKRMHRLSPNEGKSQR